MKPENDRETRLEECANRLSAQESREGSPASATAREIDVEAIVERDGTYILVDMHAPASAWITMDWGGVEVMQ